MADPVDVWALSFELGVAKPDPVTPPPPWICSACRPGSIF